MSNPDLKKKQETFWMLEDGEGTPKQSSSSADKVISFFLHKMCYITFYFVWPAVVRAKWARRIQWKSQVLNDSHLPHATLSLQGVSICLKSFNLSRLLRLRLVLVLSVLLLSIGTSPAPSSSHTLLRIICAKIQNWQVFQATFGG